MAGITKAILLFSFTFRHFYIPFSTLFIIAYFFERLPCSLKYVNEISSSVFSQSICLKPEPTSKKKKKKLVQVLLF